MSCIRSEFGGWVQLIPPTVNEVWELVVWSNADKAYVPNKSNEAKLRKMGTRPGLPPTDYERSKYA